MTKAVTTLSHSTLDGYCYFRKIGIFYSYKWPSCTTV